MFLPILALSAAFAAPQVHGGSPKLQWQGLDSYDSFGDCLAIIGDVDGDGHDDIAIGAPGTSPGGAHRAGSVYLYSSRTGALLLQWDGQVASESLGYVIGAAGDVNGDGIPDLIIGSQYATPGGLQDRGSAFVYSCANGALLHQWDGDVMFSKFGRAVAGAGDVDGDGFADVLISGRTRIGLGSLQSKVVVFSGANGSEIWQWIGNAHSWLSESVSGAGDVNGDGFDDFFIGAPGTEVGSYSSAGAAYLLSGADGSILHSFQGIDSYDYFGRTVAGVGDLDGDGVPDLAVGASGENYPAGAAYVFSGASGAQLFRWEGDSNVRDEFGYLVHGAGDFDGDGIADVIVTSTPFFNGSPWLTGHVDIYSGADGSLLRRWDSVGQDRFGTWIDGEGDIDGDGSPDIVVGAEAASPSALPGTGAVFVFGANPFLIANTATVSASSGGAISFDLDFSAERGFDEYKILLSGTGPGPFRQQHDDVIVPLSLDGLMIAAFQGSYPVANHVGMHGALDASGAASATMTIPATLPPGLIGRTYYFAAVVNQPGQEAEASSVAVAITVTP